MGFSRSVPTRELRRVSSPRMKPLTSAEPPLVCAAYRQTTTGVATIHNITIEDLPLQHLTSFTAAHCVTPRLNMTHCVTVVTPPGRHRVTLLADRARCGSPL